MFRTKKPLKTAARGTVFRYAGQEWVALEHDDTGRTLCLAEKIVDQRAFDEDNLNNFAVASSNKYLNGTFLDNLIKAAPSQHAFLSSELDLTADDGLKSYGACTVTIFLLTVDQYRRNRDVIPNAGYWWWLSTAYRITANVYASSVRLVSSDDTLGWGRACSGYGGLRPACYLDSNLLISVDEEDEDTGIGPQEAGTIVAELVEQFGGTYATEIQFISEISFLLGKLRALRETEIHHEQPSNSSILDELSYQLGWIQANLNDIEFTLEG